MVLWLLPLILGYGENPLPEMTSLAEAHGIRLFSLPTVGRDVDALITPEILRKLVEGLR